MQGELRIGESAAAAMRAAIRLAGGREVCFVATVTDGNVATARAVARGDATSVLALPGVARAGELLLHNHPSGVLEPSDADNSVAHKLFLDGIGFGIINNDATSLYMVVEVPRPRAITELRPGAIAAELSAAGLVGKRIAGHEERASQKELAATIARIYNDGGTGVLEAGTGVGKSFAYLLPALRWWKENGERTVVSTNTINLQEQIVGKDLPLMARALNDQEVSYAILKGWRNYLCLMRLDNAIAEGGSLFDQSAEDELRALGDWANRSTTGSLSELPAAPRTEVWDEVAAEPDLCTRQKCPHFSACFLFSARKAAAAASVVVVNHHLLMADIAVRRAQQNWTEAAVLPWYTRLVVDEGHNLEEAAAQHLGNVVTRRGVQRLFARLDRRGKGLLHTMLARFTEKSDLMSAASRDLLTSRLLPSTEQALRLARAVFEILEDLLGDQRVTTMRLTPAFAEHPVWSSGLRTTLQEFVAETAIITESLELIRGRLVSGGTGEEDTPLLAELTAVVRRLSAAADSLNGTLHGGGKEDYEKVRWIELRGGGRSPNLAVSEVPLDLSGILRTEIFDRMGTTVVTSATLTAGGSFDYVTRRLGLEQSPQHAVLASFPSPFHYHDQALLAIPADFPPPNERPQEHFRALLDAVLALSEFSDGGVFVLCTSHRDLKALALALRSRGDLPWPLMVQGEGEPREGLLQRFRDSGRGVLIGTSSFWEGVDVKGSALRGLVITRLPFKVPTEPITAATCEAIAAFGGDPFSDYLLPHAALRLKQGFGRLIRSSNDWGAVLLADSRIANRPYGDILLDSLPPARRSIARWEEVREELRTFYKSFRSRK